MTTPSVNPSGRVQRVSAPMVAPGQCGICGRAEHKLGFADPKLDFEYYGTLYFCATCTGDIASVFGYVSPTDIVALREHIAAQDSELNTLRQAILGLESAVDGLANYRDLRGHADDTRRRGAVVPPLPNANAVDAGTEGDATEPESVPTGSTVGPPSDEPKADPSGNKQGRNDVRDSASADVDELLNL